ncbi:MAG: M23 family metallopeptidase [Verrucomicrobia bacterium]|nr:MAG: M23 family metallopeptidase [Verrucomicrobiota bacterium]
MRWPLSIATLTVASASLLAQDTAAVKLADGFQSPVGSDGQSYYRARGMQPNGHLGDDWNGTGGGDTELGAPVTATAHGLVVFARDFRLGWGNVVIVRHAYLEAGQVAYADSLYGHLDSIVVQEGQQVVRGQKVGTIGNNRGMYNAHLHFELRKNLRIGMARSAFPRDFTNYWDPHLFIAQHQRLEGGGRLATVPINTFVTYNGPADYAAAAPAAGGTVAAHGAPTVATAQAGPTGVLPRAPLRPLPPLPDARPSATSRIKLRSVYKVDPYEDMRTLGGY